MVHKKLAVAVAISAALGASSVFAAQTTVYNAVSSLGNNFSMLTPNGAGATGPNPDFDAYATANDPNADPYTRGGAGYAFGGSNRVSFNWDGTLFDASTDYTGVGSVSNASLASPDLFFGAQWTTHDVQVFGPGSYTFDSTLANGGANNEFGDLNMTVGANQIGAHMLFDWNGNLSIDVVNVWDIDTTFGDNCATSVKSAYASNCIWTGTPNPGGNGTATTFMFSSTDNDSDGTLGVPMAENGPFAFNNANFSVKGELTAVPIPAAAWLFGSGLIGLVGVARRRKVGKSDE